MSKLPPAATIQSKVAMSAELSIAKIQAGKNPE
jgi:hypothetical protein